MTIKAGVRDIKPCELKMVMHTTGDPWSVSLNESHQKEQIYIWFRGGDLNGFWDLALYELDRGGAYPRGSNGWCLWKRLIIRNNNLYG